jgi:hypothetical protein
MSYGNLYKLQYYDFFNVLTEIYIKQLDYAGDSTDVSGGPEPLRITLNNDGSEKFQTIRGTSVEIDLLSETNFQFISLHTSDFKQYQIQIDKGGATYWKGWLLPDYYQEPYEEPPYVVTIHASDGLGLLKNYGLVNSSNNNYTGKYYIWALLNSIFYKIGTELDLWENINIYEDNINSTAADSVINQIVLNAEIFYDVDGNPMNCYDVLTEILKPFNAYVIQSGGLWHIIRVPTNKESYTRRKWIWSVEGMGWNYDSNESHDPQLTTTGDTTLASLIRFVGNTLTVSPPWKEFKINQYYGTKENILQNGDFNYDSFVYSSGMWWTQHWVRSGSCTYEPVPKNKNWITYVPKTDYENRRVSRHVYNHENFVPMDYKPDNEYCIMIVGTSALLANAYYIYNDDTSIVTSATDKLLIHFEFSTNSASVTIYLQVSIVGATTEYLSADGTWGAVAAYISIASNPENGWVTKEIIANTSFITGNLTVKLFETVGGAETDFVKWANVNISYLPAGIMPDKELNLITPVNSNNIYIPSDVELILGDMPSHDNNSTLYENGLFYLASGIQTPTSIWTDDNSGKNDTLVNCLSEGIKLESNKPYQVISGTIYSKLIDWTTIVRESNNSNYLFMINGGTLYDKNGAWDLELIQFAETYDLLSEASATLVSEAGDQLITE